MMNCRKNKFKNFALSSKGAKKKKYNEESSSSPRNIVKRAENRLSLILKKSKKADHGNHYAKSDNRSAIYPLYKRPRNQMNSKFARNQKEKKKRFSPRITSTLKCDPNMSTVSNKSFCNSFNVLRVQSNYHWTPDVDDPPVGSYAGNSFLRSTQEAVNSEPSTSNNRKSDEKSPTRVVEYQRLASKIKTSLLEASDILTRNIGVNLKTKITNLLIDTYNKSNNSNSKIQNYRKTPPLENVNVSPAVTEFNNSYKSPHLNHLQQCKSTAVSSSSSSALTPHFELIPESENTANLTLINPVKFIKKYERGVSKETECCNASNPLQNLLLTPHSPQNAKVFSALAPKSVVVNPVSYMKQYDDLLSQNYENEKYVNKIEKNVNQKSNHVPSFDQSENVKDFNFIFDKDAVFPSSSAFYRFDKGNQLISSENPAYFKNYHSLIPQYRKPEEHFIYNPSVQPSFSRILEPTNPPHFRNWGYDAAPGRHAMGQTSRIPQENFIFNIQNQSSNFQGLNNWRSAVPLHIKPPENSIFPLSGGTEFEIDIPPDFEQKIF